LSFGDVYFLLWYTKLDFASLEEVGRLRFEGLLVGDFFDGFFAYSILFSLFSIILCILKMVLEDITRMRDIQNLRGDFNLHNLLIVVRLFYGYFVFAAIIVAIVWLLRYFSRHEPSGTKITEMFDEKGKKKTPLNLKPVLKVILIIIALILIYIVLLFVRV
jgi:quinol-cytochrome oxidoreductase complex cytochrome b subunit